MNLKSGDIITVDFPAVTGVKRRPAVILSSATYHAIRPDIIIGLITTQTKGLGDWQSSGLRVASIFRSFIVTLPASTNMILIGQLSERDWQGVRGCLKLAIAESNDLR